MNQTLRASRIGGTLIRALAAALLLALAVSSPAAAQLPAPTPTPTPDPLLNAGPAAAGQLLYAPGELIVAVRTAPGIGVSAASGLAVAAAVGAQVTETFDVTGPNDNIVTHLLAVPPGQEYEVAAALARESTVVYVEPNWIVWAAQDAPGAQPDTARAGSEAASPLVEPGFVVNDPFYASRQWNMQRINAARAWQMAFASGAFTLTNEVVVAVVDSGLDIDHPDFKGRVLPGKNYVKEDLDGDGFPELDPQNVTDRCGHGTHVAGIIAAALNDSVGVAGVAPNVKISGWRALGASCGGTVSDVAQAIEDAALSGADIINLSLVLSFNSPTIEAAVNLAAAQGALMVAAAGNAGAASVFWPARYPEVVAVAALNIHDQRTSYSNYGPEIEIAAPGGDSTQQVFSTWSKDAYTEFEGDPNDPNDNFRTYRCTDRLFSGGGEYCTRYGTSQATPAVAGVAALLLSVNPTLTMTDVRQILVETATPLGENAEYVGAGKVDALAALRTQLPNALVVSPANVVRTVPDTAEPFTLTVRVDNPSLTPVAWTATLESSLLAAAGGAITPSTWITLTSGVSNTQSATTAFGAPDFLSLLISPTAQMSGMYEAALVFTATTSLGPVTQRTGLLLNVTKDPDATPPQRVAYMPLVMGHGVESANVPYTWAEPATPGDRITIPLTDTSIYTLSQLPVAITIGTQPINRLRIYSDGFVTAPDTLEAPVLPFPQADNRCVPRTGVPATAVYGWWADLDPGADGAQVSAFRVGTDRYVIEFANVPAINAAQPYTVSFQIVLHQNGSVGLNYAETPTFDGAPGRYTVGVETFDALFYARVACVTDSLIVGEQPSDEQSLLLRARDIF